MLYIPWMVILCGENIKKKTVSKTSIFELPKVKNYTSRLCTGPFTHVGHYWLKRSFRIFGTGCERPYKKTSFCILVGIYCHNIPTHTPQSGEHGVTEVAKTANIAKMADQCITCMSACPTPLHTNPMESGPGNTFSAQNPKKTKKIQDI